MPCIYAHHSFGNKVMEELSPEIKNVIKRYREEFDAGLQGPDFLFFYHPLIRSRTNRLGYWQHGKTAACFLKKILPVLHKEGMSSGAYAYILGFICHFMLDGECHSYVIPLSEKPGYNHLVIENEFDRHLLKQDGFVPVTYPVWKLVRCRDRVADAVYKVYRPLGLSRKQIVRSFSGMRFYKRLFTCGSLWKRFWIRFAMFLTWHYRQLEGQMLSLRPKKYAKKTNAALQKRYCESVPLTADMLQAFHRWVWEEKPLPDRFFCTFRSNRRENAG